MSSVPEFSFFFMCEVVLFLENFAASEEIENNADDATKWSRKDASYKKKSMKFSILIKTATVKNQKMYHILTSKNKYT